MQLTFYRWVIVPHFEVRAVLILVLQEIEKLVKVRPSYKKKVKAQLKSI